MADICFTVLAKQSKPEKGEGRSFYAYQMCNNEIVKLKKMV